jgi:glycosyltransferase involved in cell wall biosynthesis
VNPMRQQSQQHVLFIVNSYPPRLGGLENHVAALAARLVVDGHRSSVVTLSIKPTPRTSEHGVHVTRLRGRLPIASVISFPAPGTARRLAREFRNAGVTAVSTHTRFFPMSFVGRGVARRLGVPHLHTEHGSDHVRGVSWPIGVASRLVDRTLGRAILRSATVVLAVSEQVATFVRGLAGVPSVLFYNAIDAPGAPMSHAAPASDFVFVGRMVPGKGWDDLLEATRMLLDDEPGRPLRVELLGSGPDLPEVEARADRLGLTDVVVVRGQVSPAEVHAALARSVLVNPTRLSEGFQTTLLEALAAGSQIVTYPAPGVERLRADGAPVRIVASASVDELAVLMRASRDRPLPPFPAERLAGWTWPERARQYEGILDGLRRR